jgi:hypothetical protein
MNVFAPLQEAADRAGFAGFSKEVLQEALHHGRVANLRHGAKAVWVGKDGPIEVRYSEINGKLHIGGARRIEDPEEIERLAQASTGPGAIQARFEIYHQANPAVYQQIVRLARKAKASGLESYSIAGIFEVLRWEMAIITRDPSSTFKISNDYRSRYARLVMEQEPDLEGFFHLRELRSEDPR